MSGDLLSVDIFPRSMVVYECEMLLRDVGVKQGCFPNRVIQNCGPLRFR